MIIGTRRQAWPRSGTLAGLLVVAALGVGEGQASPPPPPPSYVADAVVPLTDPAVTTEAVASLFAGDVIASENGRVVAAGKAAWLRWRQAERRHYYGRTIGSSSASANADEPGSLLVLDSFDTIDIAAQPPGVAMDPRLSTRSTLYRFGDDHLIHRVEMAKVAGFWTPAPH